LTATAGRCGTEPVVGATPVNGHTGFGAAVVVVVVFFADFLAGVEEQAPSRREPADSRLRAPMILLFGRFGVIRCTRFPRAIAS
jgi:hypothetical protein